jgi:hypothetical protein
MTDRELLELAAKAAGYKLSWPFDNVCVMHGDPSIPWSPLTDDGDALRLAVKLIEFEPYKSKGYFSCIMRTAEETRRAIVRAAAEIGKAIQ